MGKRKVQNEKGQITLPKGFREDNDIEKGDYITWKRHTTDNRKLIITPREEDE
jgi:bifunctional DNA-binding transcriptional regulator/antitoxin component of YhaV-PrlF toxin-antitoxin module